MRARKRKFHLFHLLQLVLRIKRAISTCIPQIFSTYGGEEPMNQNAKRSYTTRLMACLKDYQEQSSPFEPDKRRTDLLLYGDNDASVLDLDKYEILRRQLLEKEGWGEKFTEENIDEALKRLFRRSKQEGNDRKGLAYFTELVDRAENYP